MCRKSELDTHTKKHQNLTKSSLKFWGGGGIISPVTCTDCKAPSALPRSSVSGWTTVAMTAVYWRLKSLQELQHHRGRERERERLGVAGRGLDYLHPSPSPGAVISCFALYALLFTLLMKNSVHVLFGFFFFLNRKSFEFFKMKRNLITYKNQKIH